MNRYEIKKPCYPHRFYLGIISLYSIHFQFFYYPKLFTYPADTMSEIYQQSKNGVHQVFHDIQ